MSQDDIQTGLTNAKVSLGPDEFGSANPERLTDLESSIQVKGGMESVDQAPTNKRVLIALDKNDPDKQGTINAIGELLRDRFDINFVHEENKDVPSSMGTLVEALHNDHSYAWSWHCNIAMSARDEGVDVMTAQKLASRFLQVLTLRPGKPGIDTRTFDEYKAIEAQVLAESKE